MAGRGRRWTRWLGAILALLVVLATALGVTTWRTLPQQQGELPLAGLRAPVTVQRDAHGIPGIEAGSVEDAMFALGAVHAQDRLWQMETHRRIAAGRLAEVFGPKALETDRLLRVLGLRRLATAQWAWLQLNRPATAAALRAYAAGVNGVMAQLAVRPPEFVLLNVRPEPWLPEDSLAWNLVMALDLGGNWQSEALRLALALALPDAARVHQVLPAARGDAPPGGDLRERLRELRLLAAAGAPAAAPPAAAASAGLRASAPASAPASVATANRVALERLLAAAPPSEIEGLGSNNWVVGPARSQTGAPLLANDPHLRLSTPSLWYLARLKAPGLDVAGATMPGTPGIVLGQNADIAWGFTNTGPDVQDLYAEEVDPADPTRYRTPDGWARFEVREETLQVRGQPPQTLTVRHTRHGPVISDLPSAVPPLKTVDGASLVLALRWTALTVEQDSVGTALAMAQARSVEAFIQATRGWVAPMQSMVVADRQGHIGLVAPGHVPRRGPDHSAQGAMPVPGWDARFDWQGVLPFEQLPVWRDPPEGFLATANQKIVGPDYPHLLGTQWALPHRHDRIVALLRATPKHTLETLRAIQADQVSLAAPALLPTLRAVRSTHRLAAAAMQELQGFEGEMRVDRAAPSIHWVWQRRLAQRIFADELGAPTYDRLLNMRGYFDPLDDVIARQDGWWCDDKTTPAVTETCVDQARMAFDDALDELSAMLGGEPRTWAWGRLHVMRGEHRPFSHVKPLARWFETRMPVGGDTHTVNVSRVSLRPDPTTGELYLDEHGPGFRGLYDLQDRSRSRVIHAGGQSGIPWSRHYRSLMQRWVAVDGVALWPTGAESVGPKLTLQPVAGRELPSPPAPAHQL